MVLSTSLMKVQGAVRRVADVSADASVDASVDASSDASSDVSVGLTHEVHAVPPEHVEQKSLRTIRDDLRAKTAEKQALNAVLSDDLLRGRVAGWWWWLWWGWGGGGGGGGVARWWGGGGEAAVRFCAAIAISIPHRRTPHTVPLAHLAGLHVADGHVRGLAANFEHADRVRDGVRHGRGREADHRVRTLWWLGGWRRAGKLGD